MNRKHSLTSLILGSFFVHVYIFSRSKWCQRYLKVKHNMLHTFKHNTERKQTIVAHKRRDLFSHKRVYAWWYLSIVRIVISTKALPAVGEKLQEDLSTHTELWPLSALTRNVWLQNPHGCVWVLHTRRSKLPATLVALYASWGQSSLCSNIYVQQGFNMPQIDCTVKSLRSWFSRLLRGINPCLSACLGC